MLEDDACQRRNLRRKEERDILRWVWSWGQHKWGWGEALLRKWLVKEDLRQKKEVLDNLGKNLGGEGTAKTKAQS